MLNELDEFKDSEDEKKKIIAPEELYVEKMKKGYENLQRKLKRDKNDYLYDEEDNIYNYGL